jgi:hypothetical protein
MTHLRKIMLEELQRRHYSEATTQRYIRLVERFAQHFHCSPQQSCRPRVSDRTMVGNYATRLACEFQRTERRRHDEHETKGWSQHRGPVAPRLTGPLRDRAERSSS